MVEKRVPQRCYKSLQGVSVMCCGSFKVLYEEHYSRCHCCCSLLLSFIPFLLQHLSFIPGLGFDGFGSRFRLAQRGFEG